MILFFSKLFAVLLIQIFFILFFSQIAKVINLLDYPDNRKRHQGNIPLVGGLCIFSTLIFPVSSSTSTNTGIAPD